MTNIHSKIEIGKIKNVKKMSGNKFERGYSLGNTYDR